MERMPVWQMIFFSSQIVLLGAFLWRCAVLIARSIRTQEHALVQVAYLRDRVDALEHRVAAVQQQQQLQDARPRLPGYSGKEDPV